MTISEESTPAKSEAGLVPLLALLAGNVLLSLGPLLVRLAEATGEVGPVTSAFWRVGLAAPLLLLFARRDLKHAGRMPGWMWLVLGLGGVFFASDLAFWHSGILLTRMANATLLGNASSFLFPLYGFLLVRAFPDRRQGVALLLALAGVILLVGRSYDLSPRYLLGDLFCLAAGLLYTGYLIALERGRTLLPAWPTLSIVTAAAVPPLLAAALLLEDRLVPTDWTAVATMALSSQVLGQGLLVYSLTRVSPLVVGLALLMQPVVGAAIGWTLYGERIGLADVIGAAAIGAALVLVSKRR